MMKKLILLLLPLWIVACKESEPQETPAQEQPVVVDTIPVPPPEPEYPPGWTIVVDSVQPGEGLFQVLSRMAVNDQDRRKVVLTLQDSVELFKMRVGQIFTAEKDSTGAVQKFSYRVNSVTTHVVTREDSNFVYSRVEAPTFRRMSAYEGTLEAGGTLNGLLHKVGIPTRMVGIVSGVLQCKVAFPQAQPGDRFRILLEEVFSEDSVWISGKVMYAEFDGRTVGHHEAFRFEDSDPKSSYNAHYTESGEALIFDGLRYPLDRLHVTSAFGRRVHPITGQMKSHNGIDYGNPTGTPVYAVAEGVVVVSGYDDLSGNKIAIKHRDDYVSYYMHLSARSVGVGAKVSARQPIGKVGSTGRSTGPHLHFGFKDNKGRWINPATKTMIATPKLKGERLAMLQSQVVDIRKEVELTFAAPAVKANDTTDVMVHMRQLE